mgnify:CR=1 FL=1
MLKPEKDPLRTWQNYVVVGSGTLVVHCSNFTCKKYTRIPGVAFAVLEYSTAE